MGLIYLVRTGREASSGEPPAPKLHCLNLSQKTLNAEWVLSAALGALARRRYARALFFSWPNLQAACLRLAGFLTNHYPGERRTLLEECLATAIQRYESMADDSQFELAPARAFLIGLIEHAPRVLDYRVYGICKGNKTVCWDLFSRPVSTWARNARVKRLVFEPTSFGSELKNTRFVHFVLASHVLEMRDLVVMRGEIEAMSGFAGTSPGE